MDRVGPINFDSPHPGSMYIHSQRVDVHLVTQEHLLLWIHASCGSRFEGRRFNWSRLWQRKQRKQSCNEPDRRPWTTNAGRSSEPFSFGVIQKKNRNSVCLPAQRGTVPVQYRYRTVIFYRKRSRVTLGTVQYSTWYVLYDTSTRTVSRICWV